MQSLIGLLVRTVLLAVLVALGVLASARNSEDVAAHGLNNQRLVLQFGGKCIDVLGFGTSNGSLVGQWTCNGLSNQQWDIVHTADGYHNIKPRHVSNKCLDVLGLGTGNGADIGIWTCNGGDNQKFTFPCSGCWGDMRPKHVSGQTKCVDLNGFLVGNGALIKLWTCNGLRNQQWFADSHTPEKSLYLDRWYQFYEDTNNYGAWMTLTTHRNTQGFGAQWNQPTSEAVANWNDPSQSRNTVYLSGVGSPSAADDIHIVVTNDCFNDAHFGVFRCASGLGITYLFDEGIFDNDQTHQCGSGSSTGDCDNLHSKPDTWWYAMAYLDNDAHTGPYGTLTQRRATTAHEIGHTIGLAHDGSGIDCPTQGLRITVMDTACNDDGVDGPENWDNCGINHAYHDTNWGFNGC